MSRTAPDEFDASHHYGQTSSLNAYTAVSSSEPNEKNSSANPNEDVGIERGKQNRQKLESRQRQIVGALVDIFCIFLCIAIIVFAVFVRKNDGVEMGTHQRQLLDIFRTATTFFPYLFALIVSRGIRNVLNWRLARGINMMSFAYLSKCSTLANALIAPLGLRTFNRVPLMLIAIWVFSPLGSQGVLRSVSELQTVQTTNSTVLYYYPAASRQTESPGWLNGYNAANAVLFASFLSVGTSLNRSEDTFGNIKIPTLSKSNGYYDSTDWINMPASGWATYSSLIGIPFLKPTNRGNSTFKMRSWYWHLSDPTVSLSISGTGSSSTVRGYPWLPTAQEGLVNYTSTSGYWQFLFPNSTASSDRPASLTMPLMFENANPDNPNATSLKGSDVTSRHAGITRLSANLTHVPVEMHIFCNTGSCNTTAIRLSELVAPYPLESDLTFFTQHLLWWLAQAIPITHKGTPEYDVFNYFLNDSNANPFSKGYETLPDLASLGATELASRLEQVINAYWIAHSALAGVVNLNSLNLTEYAALSVNTAPLLANANATLLDFKSTLRCDKRWLSILCLATIIMMAAAATSLTFNWLYSGPEVSDFTSALMRSYRMPEFDRGTWSGDDLVRQLRHVSIKVGDASSESNVASIVIGPQEVVGSLDGK
ncbi:unnamed protein product [Periconia digitata]|uniref:Uncharacterized protein n=1 Tax=Periconia digitata TaxID=1303443 RepID=A0A9W4UK87_9PLEO|nr:unnamed protein product [Periconia digitata]